MVGRVGHRLRKLLENLNGLVALNYVLQETERIKCFREPLYRLSHVFALLINILAACNQFSEKILVGFNEVLHLVAEHVRLLIMLNAYRARLSHNRR